MKRRHFTGRATAVAGAALLQPMLLSVARAQTFPSRTVTIVVGFAAGGPADSLARAVAQEASTILGQSVVVDNRAGANGKIAMQALLRAPRDGHTIAYISPSIMSIAPLVDKDLGYDTQKDILPLTTGLRGSNIVAVHPSVPARNLRELVAFAKANPGKLNYGSIGAGSWYHLTMEKLLVGLGIEATHVPYKGEAPALTDMVAGHLQLMIVSGAGKAFLDDGKLIALAATGSKPAQHYPKAPSVRDSGIAALSDFDEAPWIGFGMAAGAPQDVVNKIHGVLVKALQSSEVRNRIAAIGEVQTCSPGELQEIIRREVTTYRQLVESGRVKIT
jgi:tripartite-type tricarboxylate transporter receptor subunit TctC